MTDHNKPALLIPVRPDAMEEGRKTLPALLQSAGRGTDIGQDPFLANVVVEATYPLAAVGRGEAGETRRLEEDRKLLALEAADGSTVFIRADRLREELARLYPEAVKDGQIDLSQFRDREAASRGGTDWLWSKLSVLTLGKDAILDAAKDQALEWAQEWLGEKVQEVAEAGASWLGAKALMWAIESRLQGEPGLYHWRGAELTASDRLDRNDPRLTGAAREEPMLVFIHGTGSHTLGSFKDLRSPGAAADWEPLALKFGERVFGFEHRTFSESPIDNALALAELLPAKARLSLVTHSRGGLVGDLLCIGTLDEVLIDAYRRDAPVNSNETEWQRRVREKVAAEEQGKLRRLRRLLDEKGFQIERYVRVASPARGTTLLSDNLDVFLSCLLSLMNKLVGAVAGPAASAVLSAFKRIVLEIADKRVEPQLVPGIEAMLTDAPMGMLLARAPRKQGIEMAVIAGDIEGGGLLKRIGVMFTDWMFFDKADNDLVVDTASMYSGLARPLDTRYLYDKGESVNHFSYFDNRLSRAAVRDWLTVDAPADLAAFSLLEAEREPTPIQARELARVRSASRGVVQPDSRPVVILLPGIMGSHLERRAAAQPQGGGDRVWFDPLDLAAGGLGRIRYGQPDVRPEALFEMFYGDLTDYLEASHTVIRFPYDWRRPIQETADTLVPVVRQALDENPHQPVRLLAHSMGGLVVRAMIAKHSDVWKKIVARSGGRFIMLGTPNNGSHLMVETLLGKSDTVRKLARLDLGHKMSGVLEIIAGFPGALQLLPRPGFQDSGQEKEEDYFKRELWDGYRNHNKDRWFGDGLVGVPDAAVLQTAKELWGDKLLRTKNTSPDPADRVAYVFGQADNTACGVRIEDGRLKMIGTSEGDGSVTWASGRLAGLEVDKRCWHMPVAHGNLADSEEHFPAILDLLQTGETSRLGRLPVSRGVAATRVYDAGPVPYPSEEEVTRSLLGAMPKRRKARAARRRLAVRVVAMDLRYVQLPVLCGHYIGDPIAGAEAQIDRYVVDGALSQRERLGVYAGEIGTTAVALNPRGQEDIRRGTGSGAVIVGLGKFGELSVGKITESVRSGVLRFLLHTADCSGEEMPSLPAEGPKEIGLASLLIGYNSTANISVEDSVAAIVRGVCEANRQFEDAMGAKLRVGRLEFVELYRDNAITAARAVQGLARRMERDLQRLGVVIDARDPLEQGFGVRERLSVSNPFGYWPQLMVTDADRSEEVCPPECYRVRRVSPIPEEVVRELVDEELRRGEAQTTEKRAETTGTAGAESQPGKPPRTVLAERLKYIYLSERARAEAVVHQRQPGLIEALVKHAIHQENYNEELARTLFHLMVPLDFKAAARETERLVLIVDSYTANLPWEMLQADDQPLVLRTRLVRQLVSARFRKAVHSTNKTACVIVDPSTEGFVEHFGKPGMRPLPPLPGAVQEGEAVRKLLDETHYQVEFVPSESQALDVIGRLYKRPYRILMIAAHGEFELTARDGTARSGVVLSDGVVLTAAEVGQMEVVPDVVFLNCCHLGKVDAAPAYNKLAYSLSRELIEMGVRCVVAAGWKVNDQAAHTFAVTFFTAFVSENEAFGEAVHRARLETYKHHPGYNTWGAYQAYGDPGFRLEPGGAGKPSSPWTLFAPQELIAELESLRLEAHHIKKRPLKDMVRLVQQRLDSAPAQWMDLPEIQFAIAALYAEYGQEAFERARAAYERAITAEDRMGRLPVKAIEQVANLEARTGENVGGAEGLALIDRALDRLKGLLACTQDLSAIRSGASESSTGTAQRANAERWALLGSTWKRKATLLARAKRAVWAKVEVALERSRNAYLEGGGSTEGADFDPYPVLNRLQLDGLVGDSHSNTRTQLVQIARRCAEMARRRFVTSYDFFDAVMVADAELAIRMIEGALPDSADDLAEAYRDALANVPASARQFDSVVKQLQLLAGFYRLRGARVDKQCAEALMNVAQSLDRDSAAVAAKPAPGETPPLPQNIEAGTPAGQAKSARGGPPTKRRAAQRRPAKGGGRK
jgi:CHAT domain-containing protein/pimeloyl-ACP methyl ester carboxylesterase